jgi:hypothetical protein
MSAKPDSHDFKIWLFTEHSVSGKCVFRGVFSSVHKSSNEIVGNVKNLTFITVLFVMEEPESPTIPVEHLIPFVNSYSFFIRMVNVESFEIINNEWSWWKTFDVV